MSVVYFSVNVIVGVSSEYLESLLDIENDQYAM